MAFELLLLASLDWAFSRSQASWKPSWLSGAFRLDSYVKSLLALLLYSYSKVVTLGVQWLDCVRLPTDVGAYHVLSFAPEVSCDSKEYAALRVWAGSAVTTALAATSTPSSACSSSWCTS